MASAEHTKPIYNDEDAARAHLEAILWPHGPVCPKCGSFDATLMSGKSHRKGLYNCKPCDKPFTVTIGTIYERSHIPLHKWVYATHLMTASKKGVSAAQLHRMLGFGSYRTAWFMAMRLREAMAERGPLPPLGGEGSVVEADETYYGKRAEPRTERTDGRPFIKSGRAAHKIPVIGLVERGGKARMIQVADGDKKTIAAIVLANVDPFTRLHTDESRLYTGGASAFLTHETVKHSVGEYARDDVNTNSAEGFFGVFKRGMIGTYQHCSEKHLSRYLDEFTFRHNSRVKLGFNDADRARLATIGAAGKHLTYKKSDSDIAVVA